jgi:hypothetical protein
MCRGGLLLSLISIIPAFMRSQDYFSYGAGNYGGLQQVIANPAAAADNPLKIDVLVAGFDLGLNNSWFAIKREALDYEGKLLKPAGWDFPDTWKNLTPGVPDNIFKNFIPAGTAASHSVIIENRLMLPSLLYCVDDKQSLAFTWSRRQIGNLDGISKELAFLFEKELDLSVTRDNNVRNEKLSAIQMSWVEYGITYARVLYNKKEHFIKAGLTPKLVQGIESAYIVIDGLDFLLSSKDTLSRVDGRFSYARSENAGSAFRVDRTFGGIGGTGAAPALDIGLIYEWRQRSMSSLRPAPKFLRHSPQAYRVKFGISMNDIGSLRFRKGGTHYDLDISLRQNDVMRYTTITTTEQLDSLLQLDFPPSTGPDQYRVRLPAAFNAQLDVAVWRYTYVNLSAHFADLYRGDEKRVHNYTSYWIAPRFECFWFDVTLPFTWNALSASRGKNIATGLMLRAGPLSLGTNDLQPYFRGDVSALNFFFTLRCPIPDRKMFDRDRDGISDRQDSCPEEAGDRASKGCPDKDKDGVPDKEDACPNQPGSPEKRGCAH